MNILVTDTSSTALAVAIRTDTFSETKVLSGRTVQHSERLVPTVVELCRDAGIEERELDLLACTRGPGSFTGLRIGMAALKGISYATGKPLVSISTMEILAQCVPYFDGAIVTVLDAKKKRWYLAVFLKREDGSLERLLQDTDGTESDLVDALKDYGKVLVTGPDSEAFGEVLKGFYGKEKTIIVDTVSHRGTADALLDCAVRKFEKDGADDIGQGPVYIRKSDAEIALDEKLKEKQNG